MAVGMDDGDVHRPEPEGDDHHEQDDYDYDIADDDYRDDDDYDPEVEGMFHRAECAHEWSSRRHYDGDWCGKCGTSSSNAEFADPRRAKLNAAEEKYGSFGAGRALPEIRTGIGGTAFFLLLDEAGKWVTCELGGACYAMLKDYRTDEKTRAAAKFLQDWPFAIGNRDGDWLETEWERVGGETGWAAQWFTWMANESPWADCFRTKDWREAWEAGIVYDLNMSGEMLMSAMSGIRYIGETAKIPQSFVEFAKYTPNKMLAMLAAHYGTVGKSGLASSEVFNSGHSMWYTSCFNPETQMRNLLEGKLDRNTSGPMCKDWTWGNCVSIFGSGYLTTYWGPSGKIKQLVPPASGPRYETDIFGQKYRVDGSMKAEQWLKEFTEECQKWEKVCPQST